MKVTINYKGEDVHLMSSLPLEEINNNFLDITNELRMKIQDILYKEATEEETRKIREFINSDKFNGMDSLNNFFASLRGEDIIETLYIEIIFRPTNRVIKKLKLRDVKVDDIKNGFIYSDYDVSTRHELKFHPSWNSEKGSGIDDSSNDSLVMFIASSIEAMDRLNKQNFVNVR